VGRCTVLLENFCLLFFQLWKHEVCGYITINCSRYSNFRRKERLRKCHLDTCRIIRLHTWNFINSFPTVRRYFRFCFIQLCIMVTETQHSETPEIFSGHLYLFQYYLLSTKRNSAQNLVHLDFTHQNYISISS
jgi:hypothetical protein